MSSQHHQKHPPLRPLLLAGGRSTRMGSPKHLLSMPDGRPLYQHLAEALQAACPECPAVHVSLAYDSPLDARLRFALVSSLVDDDDDYDGSSSSSSSSSDGESNGRGGLLLARFDDYARAPSPSGAKPTLQVLLDGDGGGGWDVGGRSGELSPTIAPRAAGGPAAGLLAAHKAVPDAVWLVVACDFPFVTADMLGRLRREHYGGSNSSGGDGDNGSESAAPAITCFRGADGLAEPLVGIWTPEALRRLAASAEAGERGCPAAVLEELGGAVVALEPPSGGICDVKTKGDWDCALEKLKLRREPRPNRWYAV